MRWWGRVVNWLRRRLAVFGRDRRWISDGHERDRHEAILRVRLARKQPVSVSKAAKRLGVSAQTVRRRVKSGRLSAEYDPSGRIAGVYLRGDEKHSR